jgi:hypothetical protein
VGVLEVELGIAFEGQHAVPVEIVVVYFWKNDIVI